MPDLVPGAVPELPESFDHYYDMAREICRRVRHRSHLSDDEIIVLAVVASQLTLTRYIEPRDEEPGEILDSILDILDRGEVIQAVSSKMLWLLNHRPSARRDAPSGKMVEAFDGLADPDEPAPDKIT